MFAVKNNDKFVVKNYNAPLFQIVMYLNHRATKYSILLLYDLNLWWYDWYPIVKGELSVDIKAIIQYFGITEFARGTFAYKAFAISNIRSTVEAA